MSPVAFEDLAKTAFDKIKNTLGTKENEAFYKPKVGGSYPIRGVFDDSAREVDPDTERVISSNSFTFGIKLDDLPFSPVKGDTVVIKNISYRIVDAVEDGVSGASVVLVLHRRV